MDVIRDFFVLRRSINRHSETIFATLNTRRYPDHDNMITTRTENVFEDEPSHTESQGPFHRVLIDRGNFLCLPDALFENIASEARDHCGIGLLVRH